MGNFIVLDKLYLNKEDMSKGVDENCCFICYSCNNVFTSSLHKLVAFYEHKINDYNKICICGSNKGLVVNYDWLIEGYEDLHQEYLNKKMVSTVYASKCIDCGEKFYANADTIIRRGNLLCNECSKKRNRLKKEKAMYSSLSELVPDIEKYWSKANDILPKDIRLKNSSREKFITICPYCGKEVEKRYDAILRSGPYCGPCAKRTKVIEGNSLYDVYSVTARKYDESGKNKLDSKHINSGSSEKYWFKCPKCKQLYYKNLQNQIKADCEGNLGCPVCQGTEVRPGITDILSKSGYGTMYWDYEKNTVNPNTVYYESRNKYWFKCPEGHSFSMSPHKLNKACRENSQSNGCPICSGRRFEKGVNDVKTVFNGDLSRWSENSKVQPEDVTIGSNKIMTAICSGCGKEYNTEVYYFTHDLVCFCEDCRKRNYSKAEKDIVEYIRNLGFDVIENMGIGGNKSIDIYIKDKNIAIDYNGIYWHSTHIRQNINFHKDRIKEVKNALGARLYYIWEDDYKRSPDIVKGWIRNILGVNNDRKVNARDCVISYLNKKVSDDFLKKYHIQGSSPLSQNIGLLYKGEIVAVMSYTVEGNIINIKRYCSSCNVRGGFSKIVSYFRKSGYYEGAYTFSDNAISDGNLYKNNGFTLEKELRPDYMYVVGSERVHKFNFRKKYFKEREDLLYQEGMTESELALLNNLNRVYDAGKKKWVIYFK